MIGLYQSAKYSAPSGPSLMSIGRKLPCLLWMSGGSLVLSTSFRPEPSRSISIVQTELLMYPVGNNTPCHSAGKCALSMISSAVVLRPRPDAQTGSRRPPCQPRIISGVGNHIAPTLPAPMIGCAHLV